MRFIEKILTCLAQPTEGEKNTTLMSWIINSVLMELMKILLEMELSSPSLVLPPDSFSWDDSSGLEVFEKTIKSREFLQIIHFSASALS